MHPTTTARWTPRTAEPHRVRHLRCRFGLSESAAQAIAALAFGEARQ